MKRKVVFVVGLLALLTGINMQVNALNSADGKVESSKVKAKAKNISTQESLDEWMPDKNLQRALVRTLGLQDTSKLTQDALREYQGNLNLRARQIRNIQGLEYAIGATQVNLSLNFINDISPLAPLAQMKKLDLSNNSEIRDLTPLIGATSLVELDFSSNKVSDITPLRDLPLLERITLNYNEVHDLSVLQGMPSLLIIEATMQGVYNEPLSGEVGEVIKQKNNVVSFNGAKPDLKPNGKGAECGVYDKDTATLNWTYNKAGQKVGSSAFYIDTNPGGRVILKFGGQVTQPIKIAGDETNIEVRDSALYVGDEWSAKDNFVSATDKDGQAVDINGVTVESNVDTTKAGSYKVTFTILNANNEKVTQEAKVIVKDDYTSIEVKDSQLNLGDKWTAIDNFVSATDKDGKDLSFLSQVMVVGKPDTSRQGIYKVTYSVYNHNLDQVSKEATITVVGDLTSLEVKDSEIYVGDKWQAEDNFVSATNKDGAPVDINGVTFESDVDTTKAGSYHVTYSILNSTNEKISKEATITVKDDQTSIEVKDSQLWLHDKWKAEDNFVKATDKDGKDVDFKDISIDGEVDITKVGTNKVTYTILNHKDDKISKTATITMKADLTSIQVKDSTLYVGDKWQAADNFVSATDKTGKAIEFEDVMVEGKANPSEEGVYAVTYFVLDNYGAKVSMKAKITVKADQTTLEVKDTTLYAGDEWQPEDNLVKALDQDGKDINIKDITVDGDVDVKAVGEYKVNYTIFNHANEKISKEATITVKGNDLTSLQVKDSVLYFGDTWQPEDNLVKAVDQDGQAINIKDVIVEGNVEVDNEGVYKVKYTIANHANEKISKDATITVKGNDLTHIEVKNSLLYVGQKWDPADNLVKAINQDGINVGIKGVTYTGEVKTDQVGVYEVEFAILNHKQEKIKATASISVIVDQTSLEVKDSTLYIGDRWQPENNFVSATDKDGNSLGIENVDISGNVNTAEAGIYKVIYEISKITGTKISKEAMVSVKVDETTLEVKGSVLYLNDQWNPQDNIVKAIDQDGKTIDIKDIVIDGDVNTKVAKEYVVKFTVLNHKQEPVTRGIIVKVKEDLTSIEVKDSILYFGDRWQVEDNFVKASDKDGNPLDIYDVKVEGNVDIKTAGEYPVKYTVLNHAKEKITKVATITMKGHDYTYLELEDSTLYVGDKWNPADNLIKARDKDGKELGIADVMIEGEVDTSKVGTYEVEFALLNHENRKLSNIATITVKEDQTSLIVKDSALDRDDQWKPGDNIVEALDQDGNVVEDILIIAPQADDKEEKAKVIVEGQVNTHKLGKYQVTYTLMNHANERISKKVNISVQAKDNGNSNNGGDKNGNGKLPKTGYDMSIIGSLLGLAGVLGLGSLYLNRRERKE